MRTEERTEAEAFWEDIDGAGTRRPSRGPRSEEYVRALELAYRLSGTDLSDESRHRLALRGRLLAASAKGRKALGGSIVYVRVRHLLASAAVVLVVGVTITGAVWPNSLRAATRLVERLVHHLTLGNDDTVIDHAASTPGPSTPKTREVRCEGGYWRVITPLGRQGGRVPGGSSACVERFATLAAARGRFSRPTGPLPIRVRVPQYLPEGSELEEVMVSPSDTVFLFYGGRGPAIEIQEWPVGTVSNGTGQTKSSVYIDTDQPIEEVTVGGKPGAWLEGNALVWVADGVHHSIAGSGLRLNAALRIAESLREMDAVAGSPDAPTTPSAARQTQQRGLRG